MKNKRFVFIINNLNLTQHGSSHASHTNNYFKIMLKISEERYLNLSYDFDKIFTSGTRKIHKLLAYLVCKEQILRVFATT